MNLTPRYKVELVEKDDAHFYCVDNDPTFLPGVTGILNASHKFLDKWAAKEAATYCAKVLGKIRRCNLRPHDRFLETLVKRAKKQHIFTKDRAADLGTKVHDIIDVHIKGFLDGKITVWGYAGDLEIPLKSFLLWVKEENPKFLSGDQATASKIYGYGGSFDALIEDPENPQRLMILDFKTGNRLYDGAAHQCAAYSIAVQEQYGLSYAPGANLVRLGKDKVEAEQKTVRDIHDSFRGFKACLDLTRANAIIQFEDRKVFRIPKPKKEKVKA